MTATTITRPADVSDVTPATPPTHTAGVNASRTGGVVVKLVVAWVSAVAVLAGGLVLAYGMHVRANAAPVQPTWQQEVVTVDDAEVVAVAQSWGAPFDIVYAADADITVTRAMVGTHVGGEATKVVEGDRIVGAHISLRVETLTDAVIAHEVGHALGLHHDNGHSDSLMYWIQGGASGAAGVTDHDRGELAHLYEGTN